MKITNIEKQNILEKYYKSNSYNIITEQIYARGDLVGQIQQELKKKGFDLGRVDNLMGPRTINALAKALGIESQELPPLPKPKQKPANQPAVIDKTTPGQPQQAPAPGQPQTAPAPGQAPAQQQGTPAPAQESPGVSPAKTQPPAAGIKPEDA